MNYPSNSGRYPTHSQIAYCWTIPATEKVPFPVYIIEDERGMRTMDNTVDGSHPTNNPELIHLLKFKMYLTRTEQGGL